MSLWNVNDLLRTFDLGFKRSSVLDFLVGGKLILEVFMVSGKEGFFDFGSS